MSRSGLCCFLAKRQENERKRPAQQHAVQRLYRLDHLPTQEEMVEIAERWRPYRSHAVSYLFASEFEERR